MNDEADSQLLRRYAAGGGESAFAELVRRHVDFVYSAALRLVRDPHLAQDVTQGVFVALAKHAGQLTERATLAGWLHLTARNLAAQTVRTIERRRAREQEAVMMNQLLATPAETSWEQIAPQLDAALADLSESDRDAVLLRYFEKKSAGEMARLLGVSDETAQKRVTRAVERLREFFVTRGVTVGAGGLAVAIAANGVQAAPAGLVTLISSAVVLSGTAATSSTLITTKIIAMTTLQKIAVTAAVIITLGAIFETRQTAQLRARNQRLQQQQTTLAGQIEQLQSERDDATRRLAMMSDEMAQDQSNLSELVGLRNEVNALRRNDGASATIGNARRPEAQTKVRLEPAQMENGRKLGEAVIHGEAGALEKLLAEIRAEQKNFIAGSAGLNDQQRGELSRRVFAPGRLAFNLIGDAAATGSQPALDALAAALEIPEMNGLAVTALGSLAAKGDAGAIDVLTDPEKYGAPLASSISSLQPAADNGNQAAIDALAAVANDPSQQALWYLTADSLGKAAAAGNPVAINALISMSASTNSSIQRVVMQGLRGAATNQNVAAAQALRAMGGQ